jgi:predicted nucleic acid-binding protein
VPAYYLDTSALVKRYVAEIGSGWVTSIMDPAAGNLLHVARLTGVEVVSAIARRAQGGSLSAADATSALAHFRADFRSRVYRSNLPSHFCKISLLRRVMRSR